MQRESSLWLADNRLGWIVLGGSFWTLVLLSSSDRSAGLKAKDLLGLLCVPLFLTSCPRVFTQIQNDYAAPSEEDGQQYNGSYFETCHRADLDL